jgi:hypothetical protein
MFRHVWFALALCLLSACGDTSDKPLPMVNKSDPTWGLQLDRLE